MTREIEKTIGLDFEKLKIASIVQQGELNAIIKAKPKEFKELLNAIIGIDKLDIASEAMKVAYKDFREKIRESIGYDDTHIDILQRSLKIFDKITILLAKNTQKKPFLIWLLYICPSPGRTAESTSASMGFLRGFLSALILMSLLSP